MAEKGPKVLANLGFVEKVAGSSMQSSNLVHGIVGNSLVVLISPKTTRFGWKIAWE